MNPWMPKSLVPALALLALLLVPDAGTACAVCTGGENDATRYAFLWTTGFLSVLPVGMVGLAVWWLRRRARELAERESAAPPLANR